MVTFCLFIKKFFFLCGKLPIFFVTKLLHFLSYYKLYYSFHVFQFINMVKGILAAIVFSNSLTYSLTGQLYITIKDDSSESTLTIYMNYLSMFQSISYSWFYSLYSMLAEYQDSSQCKTLHATAVRCATIKLPHSSKG